jgi:hypothetical protein
VEGELEGSALDCAIEVGVVFEESPRKINDVKHMIKHWFTPRTSDDCSGWWSADVGPVEEILRQGLIAALEVSLPESAGGKGPADRNLPVDTIWVCSGDPDARFECYVYLNERQVNLVIMTPEPPHDEETPHAPAQAAALVDVAIQPQTDEVRAIAQKGQGMVVIKSNGDGGVVVKPVEHKRGATVPAKPVATSAS